MKKTLLLSAAMLGLATLAQAENKFYFFTEADGDNTVDVMGEVYGISANGKYAAIFDYQMNLSYLWDSTKPTELQLLNRTVNGKRLDFQAYSVTNDGMVVGSERPNGSYQWRPCTWQDGEFRNLELPSSAMNMNFPVAVTGDGKIIGGYIYAKDAVVETGSRSYPCVWELSSDGEYQLTVYNDMELPEMQGFIVNCMYSDGTSNGTVLGGVLNAGAGSFVPALCVGGELKVWNKFGVMRVPFEYKGEILGYFDEPTIDGVKDGWNGDWAEGMFTGADYAGNFYGIRCGANEPVPENGEGTYWHRPGFYNALTDTWTDITPRSNLSGISIGVDGEYLFVNGGREINADDLADGTPERPASFFEIDIKGKNISSIDRIDAAGKVFGGSYAVPNPTTGENDYYPFIIELEQGISGVQSVYAEPESNIGIVVTAGRIMISGAEKVAVYDMNGRLISQAADTNVEPGIYVVKADKVSHKVLVK